VFHTITPPQYVENKERRTAFYSRASRIEVYENKAQRAILLAAQTRVFPAFHHRATMPAVRSLAPSNFQLLTMGSANQPKHRQLTTDLTATDN
jgi:hypothetical protein